MRISDLIESFINQALEESGSAEIQRSNLASQFNCVPSQINYVIATRFTPEHGYTVESRRGGGGYIRITRVSAQPAQMVMHTINAVGEDLDEKSARAFISNLLASEAIDRKTAKLLLAATGAHALRDVPQEQRNRVRAAIFKQMLVNAI